MGGIEESLKLPPYMVIDVAGTEKKNQQGYVNPSEIDAIVTALKTIRQDSTVSSIAIISPYQRQVDALKNKLNPLGDARIQVGTIDSFQGSEADIVLLSMVRANSRQSVGFTDDLPRVNVAMTRAKRNLLVFLNAETFRSGEFVGDLIRDARERHRFYAVDSLRDRQQLLKEALEDRLLQIDIKTSPAHPLHLPFSLAFQTFRHGVQVGYFPNPVTIGPDQVRIVFPSTTGFNTQILPLTFGLAQYRWNGGLGKPAQLENFDPNLVRCNRHFSHLPDRLKSQLSGPTLQVSSTDFTQLVTWFRIHFLNDPVSNNESTLIQRISTQGSRIPLTSREPIPDYVRAKKVAKQAITAFEEKRYEDAASNYQKIVSQSSGDEKAWAANLLAWSLHHQYGRPQGVILAEQSLRGIDWDTMAINDFNRCRIYSTLGYLSYHAAQSGPTPVESTLRRAVLEYERALAIVEKDESHNSNQFVRGRLARVHFSLKEYDRALDLCEQSVRINPTDYVAAKTAMRIAITQNDRPLLNRFFETAKDALSRLFAKNHRDPKYTSTRRQIESLYESLPANL